MLRPDGACTQGDPHLRVTRETGAGGAHFSSLLPLREAGAGSQGAGLLSGKRGGPQRRRLPPARNPRGAARRDPGSWPEAPRCSFQVPGSPSLLPPPSSAPGCTAADSSRVTAKHVLSSLLPAGRWGLGAGVWRGWGWAVFAIPAAGEAGGTTQVPGGAEVGAGGPWAFVSRDVFWPLSAISGKGALVGTEGAALVGPLPSAGGPFTPHCMSPEVPSR